MASILEHATLEPAEEDDVAEIADHRRRSRPRRRKKQMGGDEYNLIAPANDDERDEEEQQPDVLPGNEDDGEQDYDEQISVLRDSQDRSLIRTLQRISHVPLLSDDKFTIAGVRFLEGVFALKLCKFWLVTLVSIASMYSLVRRLGWEHDPNMRLSDMWLFESNLVLLDSTLFFCVGRLHRQRGVDHLAWLTIMLAANVYASAVTGLPFMRHSVTLYEMHCKWPWKLWVFVGLLLPLIIAVILLHVHRAVLERVFVVKMIELILAVALFLLPPLTSDYFHFHHWFAGWLIGMHCNFDVWWSRAAMAWCWGLYVNGIAAYGRDPLLTCGYAYWLSTDLRCPYMQCYLDALEQAALQNHTDSNRTHVKPMAPPDWRNCSADAYHP